MKEKYYERFDARELEELRKCYENAIATGFINEDEMTFEQYVEEIPDDIVMEILDDIREEYMDEWMRAELELSIER